MLSNGITPVSLVSLRRPQQPGQQIHPPAVYLAHHLDRLRPHDSVLFRKAPLRGLGAAPLQGRSMEPTPWYSGCDGLHLRLFG